MLAGFIIVPLVSLVTKAPDRRFTDALFACYDRPRQVSAKTDLGE
jgi:SSS family solute:Na+ symporter